MDLTQLVQRQLSGQTIDQLSQQLGGVDKQQTAVATSAITSILMSALAKNASSPDGATSLNNALERDHDGSILDNLSGMLTGRNADQAQNRTLNGSGILGHILGGKQSQVIDMVSGMSGLDKGKTGSLLLMLAPVVMGMLGKAKRQQDLDSGGIGDLLSGFVKNQQKSGDGGLGMLGRILDQDGDGDVADDVMKMGSSLLGGFFKR